MIHRILIISVLCIICIAGIIGIFYYLLIKGHNKWKSFLKFSPADRMQNSKDGFVNFYTKKGYSKESILFVYDHTQKFLKADDLVLLPNDDLIKLYERQEEEWLNIIPEWFKKKGWQKPAHDTLKNALKKYTQINFEYLIEIVHDKYVLLNVKI